MKKFALKKGYVAIAMAVSMVTVSSTVMAADFPDDDITFISPASPGGGSDYLIRSLQEGLEKDLGVNIIPQYLTGGGGAIGFMKTIQSRPDGYTVVAIDNKVFTQQGMGNVNFKYQDFDYLASFYSVPYVLAVNSKLGIDSVEDILPGGEHNRRLKIGFAGIGSSTHIMSVLVGKELGADFDTISYQGAPDATAAVMGGHIDGVVMDPMDLRGALESGQMTPLVVTSGERSESLPEVPTMKELGHDIDISNWRGVAAPKGMDDETRDRWVSALEKASKDPTFVKRIEQLGIHVDFRSGPEFDQYVDTLAEELIPVAQEVASENR